MTSDPIPIPFFDRINEIKAELAGKEISLFLDYDGTLTPIVATPDQAMISTDMRNMVRQLAKKMTVSVVSGRALDDVREKVQLGGIFYVGSHGFEIVDPRGKVTVDDEVQMVKGTIDAVHTRLSQQLKDVPGALVEHVKYTISCHYRLVPEKEFPRVKEAVEDILKEYPSLRRTRGKKVFEIRPKLDWHKGKAVEYILEFLKHDPQKNIAIYIGDDTTDEDGFRALHNKGFGVVVAEIPRPSAAQYSVKNPDEVKKVLKFFMNVP